MEGAKVMLLQFVGTDTVPPKQASRAARTDVALTDHGGRLSDSEPLLRAAGVGQVGAGTQKCRDRQPGGVSGSFGGESPL